MTVDGLDFEAPLDAGDTANNNTYVVTVKATDSKGGDSAFVTVTITVTDVNEAPEFDNDITFPADLPQAEQDPPPEHRRNGG